MGVSLITVGAFASKWIPALGSVTCMLRSFIKFEHNIDGFERSLNAYVDFWSNMAVSRLLEPARTELVLRRKPRSLDQFRSQSPAGVVF